MKILNVGSLNIDRTYQVNRFVQPKETIKALVYEEFCGGKGLNQSIAIAKAGAEVYHAGAVGKDGEELLAALSKMGVHTDYVKVLGETVSGHAVIQIDKTGQNNIVICGGANDEVSRTQIDETLDHFDEGDLVLLQNEVSNTAYAIEAAKKRKLKVALNPSPFTAEIYTWPLSQVDYFILNEIEGQALAEVNTDDPAVIRAALRVRYPKGVFVLTLGENGAWFFNQNEEAYHPVFKVNAVDTTAAGDTFCGYFLAGVAGGKSVVTCLREASAASALAVGRKGASSSIPSNPEVKTFLTNKTKD